MAISIGGIGRVAGGIGGAVSSLFGAEGSEALAHGSFQAAVSFANAADIALENKTISEESTGIQKYQVGRKVLETVATQEAATAGAGVTGGSASDLLRMSMQQGGLAKALVGQQGAINANAYQQEYEAYKAQETSAVAAGNAALRSAEGQRVGSAFGFLGAGLSLVGMFL